jgi:uncharacterized membrane protein YcfT
MPFAAIPLLFLVSSFFLLHTVNPHAMRQIHSSKVMHLVDQRWTNLMLYGINEDEST